MQTKISQKCDSAQIYELLIFDDFQTIQHFLTTILW